MARRPSPEPQPMETWVGIVKTTAHAIKLFEACRTGHLPRVQRRLSEKERGQIKSGFNFVWDEKEAGMRRWTDGKSWSASRVAGSFLTYQEMEGKREPNGGGRRAGSKTPDSGRGSDESHNDGEPNGYRYKQDGLTKQSFSITTAHGQRMHLISYYKKSEKDLLRTPDMDPNLNNIHPSSAVYPDSSLNEPSGPPTRQGRMSHQQVYDPPPQPNIIQAYQAPYLQPTAPYPQPLPPYSQSGAAWLPSPAATPPSYNSAHYQYPQQHSAYPPHPHAYIPQHHQQPPQHSQHHQQSYTHPTLPPPPDPPVTYSHPQFPRFPPPQPPANLDNKPGMPLPEPYLRHQQHQQQHQHQQRSPQPPLSPLPALAALPGYRQSIPSPHSVQAVPERQSTTLDVHDPQKLQEAARQASIMVDPHLAIRSRSGPLPALSQQLQNTVLNSPPPQNQSTSPPGNRAPEGKGGDAPPAGNSKVSVESMLQRDPTPPEFGSSNGGNLSPKAPSPRTP